MSKLHNLCRLLLCQQVIVWYCCCIVGYVKLDYNPNQTHPLSWPTFVTTLFATPLLQVSHLPFKATSGDTLGWAEVRRIGPDLFGTVWVLSERLLRSPLANRQPDVTVLASVRRAQSWLGVCTGGSK